MANEEQLSILKQGVHVWNKWSEEHPGIEIDLSGTDLSAANLAGANLILAKLNKADLSVANLIGAHLRGADLGGAYLGGANLSLADLENAWLMDANLIDANLHGANLRSANLSEADLSMADLNETDLKGADLSKAHLRDVDLSGANLSKAELKSANITGAVLVGTDFSLAKIGYTNFGTIDLREAIGLEGVNHSAPSNIATRALIRSKGKIPEVFLRGCGLSDWEIEAVKLYNPDLSNEERNRVLYKIYDLQVSQAIQVSPLFISYSHANKEFVDKVGAALNTKGIRYWRDIHELKAGRIETQIDRGIRQNPTVLLVLSEHSLSSDWVEHEVRTARTLEKDIGRDVLCPVALDESWNDSKWDKHLMEQVMKYNILDFSAWEDDVKFEGMFRKLIDGLELFYKDTSHGK